MKTDAYVPGPVLSLKKEYQNPFGGWLSRKGCKLARLIAVMLLVGLFPEYGYTQYSETKNTEFAKQQIGLAYSTLGGSGFYYLLSPNLKDNVKITAIFVYDNDGNDSEFSFFSLGTEYQRDLYQSRKTRAYALTGLSFDNDISSGLLFEEQTSVFNIGTGLGVDFGQITRGIAFNFHITYQFSRRFGDDYHKTRVGLGGGLGIGVNF